ncbi:hypothetical protein [Streptomyces sp. NPDC005752]|uniref:hypothetical protein n=1 Tax=Streptomyces sp. NPDC005752 TaxID=3157065 RepID=UPI003403DEB3
MSIYLHFRAVAESEIRDDHTWLAAFMSVAWENDEAEHHSPQDPDDAQRPHSRHRAGLVTGDAVFPGDVPAFGGLDDRGPASGVLGGAPRR